MSCDMIMTCKQGLNQRWSTKTIITYSKIKREEHRWLDFPVIFIHFQENIWIQTTILLCSSFLSFFLKLFLKDPFPVTALFLLMQTQPQSHLDLRCAMRRGWAWPGISRQSACMCVASTTRFLSLWGLRGQLHNMESTNVMLSGPQGQIYHWPLNLVKQ